MLSYDGAFVLPNQSELKEAQNEFKKILKNIKRKKYIPFAAAFENMNFSLDEEYIGKLILFKNIMKYKLDELSEKIDVCKLTAKEVSNIRKDLDVIKKIIYIEFKKQKELLPKVKEKKSKDVSVLYKEYLKLLKQIKNKEENLRTTLTNKVTLKSNGF